MEANLQLETCQAPIDVWDADTGKHITSFTGHPGSNVVSLSFNRKGTLLASGGTDRIIRLWDVATGQQLETITEHSINDRYRDWVEVVFSHDGSKLASTGAWDLTARLWDATGPHLKTFRHTSGVYAVAFSHDDRTLATGSFDGDIRLWDTVTGVMKKILIGHTEGIRSLAFSPNGSMLVSGSSDHTVHLWEIPLTGDMNDDGIVNIQNSERPPMYWIDSEVGTLHRLIDDKVENFLPSVRNVVSLAVDATDGKLYWAEKTGKRTGRIRRANLDGTNVHLLKDLTSVPLDIALDTVNNKLYLTNAWGKVQRLNLDGSNFQPNLITGLQMPNHLALDVTRGKIYWTEQTSDSTGKIQRANLEGTNVELVKDLTSAPRGIAVDNVNGKIYLANAYGKVQRLNLNGSNFKPNLITGLESPEGIAVDAVNRKLYWAENGSIKRANLNGKNIENIVTGLDAPANIALGIIPTDTAIAAAPATVRVIPDETTLRANYPNPFNPETWIPYQLAKSAEVTLHIYATNGTLVRTLALGHQSAGIYRNRSRAAYWDGRNELGESVASGIYFYTLTAGDFTATRKMLIVK